MIPGCKAWQSSHALRLETLAVASADASARRYLRIQADAGQSFIIMDAPPAAGSCAPFIQIAAQMLEAGLHAPRVYAADEVQGFLLLEDLGDLTYLKALQTATPAEADRLMRAATQSLLQWQLKMDASRLPVYDEAFIRRELQIFVEWCVQREYGRHLDRDPRKMVGARLRCAGQEHARAAPYRHAPRLHAAQSDGLRPQPAAAQAFWTSKTRLPARSATTWSR